MRCRICGIQIGKGHIFKRVYDLAYGKELIPVDKWCFESSLKYKVDDTKWWGKHEGKQKKTKKSRGSDRVQDGSQKPHKQVTSFIR